jgi:hypothetical protein
MPILERVEPAVIDETGATLEAMLRTLHIRTPEIADDIAFLPVIELFRTNMFRRAIQWVIAVFEPLSRLDHNRLLAKPHSSFPLNT